MKFRTCVTRAGPQGSRTRDHEVVEKTRVFACWWRLISGQGLVAPFVGRWLSLTRTRRAFEIIARWTDGYTRKCEHTGRTHTEIIKHTGMSECLHEGERCMVSRNLPRHKTIERTRKAQNTHANAWTSLWVEVHRFSKSFLSRDEQTHKG